MTILPLPTISSNENVHHVELGAYLQPFIILDIFHTHGIHSLAWSTWHKLNLTDPAGKTSLQNYLLNPFLHFIAVDFFSYDWIFILFKIHICLNMQTNKFFLRN